MGELLGRSALELDEELDRPVEVVSPDLDQLLAGALGEPLREASVVLRAGELREAGVRDLADQRVLEPVRGLPRDRGARLAEQELALEEIVEQRVVIGDVRRQMLERPAPEDPPDDRPALEERLCVRRQTVDACGDEGLQRVRHTIRRAVPDAALHEHSDGLLDEQRVALGPVERLLRERTWSLAGRACELVEELLHELGALLLRERLELDRRRAHAASPPPGTGVEELGSREADDQKRSTNPVRQMLDEVEERRLRPVDVLEEEDEGLDLRDPLHHLTGAPRDLLRAAFSVECLHEP